MDKRFTFKIDSKPNKSKKTFTGDCDIGVTQASSPALAAETAALQGKDNMANEHWDIVIVGGGPAGVVAGIYAGRSRLKTVLIERGLIGGNVNNTERIENYPGFPGGIEALELAAKFKAHAEEFGLVITQDQVTGARREGKMNVVETESGAFHGKTMLIATGSSPVKLGCPGEEELWGRGISSCATCDGPFYSDLDVAVVGGGNAAVEESLYLTRFAKTIHLIHRRDQLRAVKLLQERAKAEPKIRFVWNSVVDRVWGKDGVEGLELRDVKTGEKRNLKVDGLFVFIGLKPHSDWLGDLVEKDKDGYILVDRDLRTNVPGIFAAGDVTNKLYRQVSISAGEGARAALAAERYLMEQWEMNE